MIQDSVASEASMLVRMDGSATFTIVASIRDIAAPTRITANAIHARRGATWMVPSAGADWDMSVVLSGLLGGHVGGESCEHRVEPVELGLQSVGLVLHHVLLRQVQVLLHVLQPVR